MTANLHKNSASLAIVDASLLDGPASDRRSFVESVRQACCDAGAFYLTNHSVPTALCVRAIEVSRTFFALTPEEKAGIDISQSEHFRGFSRMTNDRDWREQVHFGLEQPAPARSPELPRYHGLQGPNLWPAQLGADWRATMLLLLDEVKSLGLRLADAVAEAAGLPVRYFARLAQPSPYLLMKLICYYPQPRNRPARNGVAPHCDWSWLTVLLQSDAGLQMQSRNGDWVDVPPVANALIVNLGELLEIATNGYFRATPHRVVNRSSDRPRISIPVFINPSLDAEIEPVRSTPPSISMAPGSAPEKVDSHTHRVWNPDQPVTSFVFGESEWHRKALGRWCYHEGCCGSQGVSQAPAGFGGTPIIQLLKGAESAHPD